MSGKENSSQPFITDADNIGLQKERMVVYNFSVHLMFSADGQEFKYGREPILRRMSDGSLLSLVYTGGVREPNDENFVAVVQSYDDGETWTKPRKVFESSDHGVWGTELFTAGDIPFAFIHTIRASTHYSEINCHRSFTADNGKTWSPPESVKGVPHSISCRQGKVMSNGSWIFPVYWSENFQKNATEPRERYVFQNSFRFVSGAMISKDRGKTFSLHGYLPGPEGKNCWEPEVVELADGHLIMLMRCDGLGSLLSSRSSDYGLTWTEPEPLDVPNPGTKITSYKVGDKHILFTNVYDRENRPDRRNLEAWVTKDFTRWEKRVPLAKAVGTSKLSAIVYPHGFVDQDKQLVYLAVDDYQNHSLMKIPFGAFL